MDQWLPRPGLDICVLEKGWEEPQRSTRGIFGVMEMLWALTEEAITWVCTFVKTYEIIHLLVKQKGNNDNVF